ncbi:hypothetical protein AB0F42_10990 [Streptomyces buecherae]
MRHGLAVVGLFGLPWAIVGRDDVAHPKPAPDAYLHAARLLDVAPAAASPTRTPTPASRQPLPRTWT